MTSNRRKFIKTMGAGTVGTGLLATPVFANQTTDSVNEYNSAVKMIVRADDVGFSKVCNIGTFESIEQGVVTSADVMLDSPGTIDALERLKKLPWISVGWHTHMWGSPVLGADEVPSLVEKEGEFKGRFRLDLQQAEDVVFDEILRELRAQLDRCSKILGRIPDTGAGGRGDSPYARAMNQVNEEYNLVHNYFSSDADLNEKPIIAAKEKGAKWAQAYTPGNGFPPFKADKKWADRNIYFVGFYAAYSPLQTDSLSEVEENYDPALYYTEDRAGLLNYPKNSVVTTVWHPGYVDYWVYRIGERGNRQQARRFVLPRVQDVAALCDERVKNWIKTNRVELVNFRDALYGTREYQNYLKIKGSDLVMI